MWGWNFVQGNGNNPVGISQQWYRQRISLGDAYGYGTDSGDYWMELALPRYGNGVTSNSSSNLTRSSLWVRTCEGGSIKSWSQIGGDLYNGLSIRGTDVINSSRAISNVTGLSFSDGNVSFDSSDANSYPRFTGADASAQLALFRSGGSAGGMYLGGDSGGLEIRNGSLAVRASLSQTGVFSVIDSYQINGTTVINSSRNLSNINAGAFGQAVSAMDTTNLDIESAGNVSIRGGSALYFGVTTDSYNSWKTRIYNNNTSTMEINAQALNFNNIGYGSSTFFLANSTGLDIRTGGLLINQSTVINSDRELTLSNYAQGALQSGAINLGNTGLNYAWSGSTWATDVRVGMLLNCSETYEIAVHDSGDSVDSFMKYNGTEFEMGNDIGWGTTTFTFASDVISQGTFTSNSSSKSSFGAGSGGNQGIDIDYGSGSSDYGVIRFYSGGTNTQTIHTFSSAWSSGNFEGGSAGAINIEGLLGVTFGSWNSPDGYIRRTTGNTYFRGNLQVGDYSGSHQIEIASGGNTAGYLRFNDLNNTEGSYVRSTGATGSTGGDLVFGSRWNTDTDRIYMEMTTTTVDTPNTLFKMASSSFMFGGNNNGKESNSAQISAGQHQSNSLNFVGMSSGTTSGTRRMDFWVEGGAYFRGDVVATGNITAYGSASDKRLKKDIVKIDNAIDKIKSVSGYEFAWNENAPEDKQNPSEFGVIAQEVEEAGLDKLVFEYERPISGTDEDNKDLPDEKWKAVHYDKFVPILIEAIKEQQKQIEELKEQVSSLTPKN